MMPETSTLPAASSTSEALLHPRSVIMASVPESKSCTRCWGSYGKAQQMCFRKHTERKNELSKIVDSNQDQIIPKSLDDNPDCLSNAKATIHVQRDIMEAQKQKYDFDTKDKLAKWKEKYSIRNRIIGEGISDFNKYSQHINNKTKKADAKLTECVDEDKRLVKFHVRDFADNLQDNENVSGSGSTGYHSAVTDIHTCMETLSDSTICDSKRHIAHWVERERNNSLRPLHHIINVQSQKNKIHNEARDAAIKQKNVTITGKDQLKKYGCEEMFGKLNLGSRDDDSIDFKYLFPQLLISEETDPQVSSSELILKTREILDTQLAEKARKISIENQKRKEFERLQRDKKLHKPESYVLEETEASKEKVYKALHYGLDENKLSHEKFGEGSRKKTAVSIQISDGKNDKISIQQSDNKDEIRFYEEHIKNKKYIGEEEEDKERIKSEIAKLSEKDEKISKGDEEKILFEQASIKNKNKIDEKENKNISKTEMNIETKTESTKLSGNDIRSGKYVEDKRITEQSDVKKKKTFDENEKMNKKMLLEPSNIKKEKVEKKEKNEDKIYISDGQFKSDKSAKMLENDKKIQKIQGGDESKSEKASLQPKLRENKYTSDIEKNKNNDQPKRLDQLKQDLKDIKSKQTEDDKKISVDKSKHEEPEAPNKSKEKKTTPKESDKHINLKSIKIKSSLSDIPKVNVPGSIPAKVQNKHIQNQEYPDAKLKQQQLLDKKAAEEESQRLAKEKDGARKEFRNNKSKDIGSNSNVPEKEKTEVLKESKSKKARDIDLKSIMIKSSLPDVPKVNVAGLIPAKVPDKHIQNQEYPDAKLKQQQVLDKKAAEEEARRIEKEKAEASKTVRAEKTKMNDLVVDAKGIQIKKISLPNVIVSTTADKKKLDVKRVSLLNLSGMLLNENANMSILSMDDALVKRKVWPHTTSNKAGMIEPKVKPMLYHTIYQHEDESDTMCLDTIHDDEKAIKMVKEPDPSAGQGVMRYALSDRSFIEKGWTLLPTEKVVRKMNVYRMRPAHPEFDWFEHNKHKGQMLYESGERLAEFNETGRGRWFYRNGNIALQYYDTEDATSQQRFVVFSSGEPDERGRSRPPMNILATFDNNGNGIVFDHTGKIRLKYNQTEGVVLDKSLGPVSNWKWHSLNDPPVLHQVMIDTQLPHKDARIMKLGFKDHNLPRPDNEAMQAIEFDNFIKEKSKKMTETEFKPFQIKMKALKINEHFSLRVLDQATVYLLFRDGKTNLKLNLGMILDHREIVDTETAEVGEVTTSVEKLPAQTDSVAALQLRVEQAARAERARAEHCRRLRRPVPPSSRDCLAAGASRAAPARCPPAPAAAAAAAAGDCCPAALAAARGHCHCHERRAATTPVYYNNRLM